MHILVTGGLGYIGSHTCVELLRSGHKVTVLDNLANSRREVADRIARIAGTPLEFIEGDVRDQELVRRTLCQAPVDAVIHFAGLKAVGESVAQPLRYYEWNVGGSIVLFQEMAAAGIHRLVFSSSATVYGDPETVPIREDASLGATNPYGRSKLMLEEILGDMARADARWRIACLRYFNPVGAHESGLIGESPNGVPNNLMPYVAQVAVGRQKILSVYGNDYPTPDGTGVRDYIHVVDLALGHLAALDYLDQTAGILKVNLGTGRGYSVLEMIAAFERCCGRPIPHQIVHRRPGDIAACYADPSLAERLLGWKAARDIDAMCRDTWRWQQQAVASGLA